MRAPLSKKVQSIEPSGIRKFFDIVSEMKDAISLGVGEPDFDTPWHIREEGIYSLEQGRTFYTSNAGLKELKEEIANYLKRRFRLSYDPAGEIYLTVGGSEAIDGALRAMLDPGDEVLLPQPSYVSYEPCIVLADGVPKIIELKEEDEFKLRKQQLLDAITDKTKILIMPFPNNPTGAIMTREDLEDISEVVREHDLYVISDEIYSELTYSGDHVSIASLPGMKERTIVINGFSKSYAMTGWRLGYACGPKPIIKQMLKIHQFAIMCAPTLSQYAAISAVRDGDDDVERMRIAYNQRRNFLMKSFRDMGLKCFEPFGAFYVFPSIKEFGMTSDEFATKLLEEEKVAVVPGTAFGRCGEGFLRISYAYSIDDLKVALERIERFIERHRKWYRSGCLEKRKCMINIVLLEPEIPANTGNIGRTCCATGSRLHLIEPLGFQISDKMLKRAGMDYWDKLDVTVYDCYEDFLEKNPQAAGNMFMATTKAHQTYTDVSYPEDAYIMFGKESAGIPEEILVDNEKNAIRIPMNHNIRSLNLSNSVAIVLYEALRQNSFLEAERDGQLHRLHWHNK